MPSAVASSRSGPGRTAAAWAEATRRRLDKALRKFGVISQRSVPDGLLALASALLSQRAVPSGTALSAELLNLYRGCDPETRSEFLQKLAQQFQLDRARIAAAIGVWTSRSDPIGAAELPAATEPPLRRLIQLLNLAPDGTRRLIQMREDLLELEFDADLTALDAAFAEVFASWFNAGFLELRAIEWHSSASLLEFVIANEAVHAIEGWEDLRRRVEPADRRCYAFVHPRIADEPLIFVEVALTKGLPASLDELMAEDRRPQPSDVATTAVFYSISNCHKGLRGIPFGSFLIKRVVGELRAELPQLSKFGTLSPVPGFASWLDHKGIDDAGPVSRELAAHFLCHERNRRGEVCDPVARFHLGNGARLEAVHQCLPGRPSLASSANVMVNYVYELDQLETNHLALVDRGTIAASKAVASLAQAGRARAEYKGTPS